MTTTVNAMSAMSTSLMSLKPYQVFRYSPGDHDVVIDIKFCGICHTDVHFVKNDLKLDIAYPLTPGHEVVGMVTSVGKNVVKLKPGDKVAVGCMVDSCFGCASCRRYEEQYCANDGMVLTYGGLTKYGRAGPDGIQTHGGYSDAMVVNERFAFKVPENADLAKVAPLLCAGITVYDPLVRFGCAPDSWQFSSKTGRRKVGVAGIGGLGHMAVKIAHSFNCEVTAISTTPSKEPTARKLGAEHFVLSSDAAEMRRHAESASKPSEADHAAALFGGTQQARSPPKESGPRGSTTRAGLDVILDTVSAPHDIGPYIKLLAPDGVLVLIGLTSDPIPFEASSLVFSQKVIRGSLIGGTSRTAEMLNYCCGHGIYPEVNVIDASQVSHALTKLEKKNDLATRYVIDCSTIPKASAAVA